MNRKLVENELIEKWLIANPPKEWTSVRDLAEKYSAANKPYVVGHKKMGNMLVMLGYDRKQINGVAHYVKGI